MYEPVSSRGRRTIAAITAVLAAATIAVAAPIAPVRAASTADGLSAATAAASCWEIVEADPSAVDGVYWLVTPRLRQPDRFYCDMTTDGGGWVLIGRGRDGWDYGRLGLDTPAEVRETITGSAAFEPRQLDGTTVDGLLNGGAVDALPDGVRVRRSLDVSGSRWQEVRLDYASMRDWTWPFGGAQKLATSSVSNPGEAATMTTGGTVERFGPTAVGKRTETVQQSSNAFRAGWSYVDGQAGSSASDSFLWSATDGAPRVPFAQVFIRPHLTTTSSRATPEGQPSVTIESVAPSQVVQRDTSGSASIPLYGRYVGETSRIDARWSGGSWTTVDTTPRGGFYEGTLPVPNGGQGSLEVRAMQGTRTTASTSVLNVGVGDIYVVAGQSNAAGYSALTKRDASGNVRPNAQTATHPTLTASTFGQNDQWGVLSDPVSSTVGQIDRASLWRAYGSPWPLLATKAMKKTGVPVAFVPAAMPGSGIAKWEEDGALYTSMLRRIGAVGGHVTGILWFQGETDAQKGMNGGEYQQRLTDLVRANESNVGVPTLVGVIGHIDGTGIAVEHIRQAQKTVIDTEPSALPGPVMYDVNLTNAEKETTADGLHYKSDAELATLASRWWAAVDGAFYGGTHPAGPTIDAASSGLGNAAKSVTLVFTGSGVDAARSKAIRPESFRVTNDGRNVTVTRVDVLANGRVRLTFSGALSRPGAELRVAYGAADWAVDHALYDAAGLPVMSFYQVSIPTRR